MKTWRCPSGAAHSARSSVSASAMSPLNSTTLALALLLISAIPLCRSAPVFLNPSTIDADLFLSQIDKGCSSYLSAERPLRTTDALRDLCEIMLGVLRKSQEFSARETSKRLIPQLHKRRRRRDPSGGNQQGPGIVQSRGFFIYRPRNGRRSSEYV